MFRGRHIKRRRARVLIVLAAAGGSSCSLPPARPTAPIGTSSLPCRPDPSRCDRRRPRRRGNDAPGGDRRGPCRPPSGWIERCASRSPVAGGSVTPAELGETAGIAAAVDRALAAGGTWARSTVLASVPSPARRRRRRVALPHGWRGRGRARRSSRRRRRSLRATQPSAIAGYTDIDLVYARAGRKLTSRGREASIGRAVRRELNHVRLSTARVAPDITRGRSVATSSCALMRTGSTSSRGSTS